MHAPAQSRCQDPRRSSRGGVRRQRIGREGSPSRPGLVSARARLGQGEVDVTRAYGRTGLIIQDVGTKGLARKPEVSTFSPLQRHVTPNEVAFLNIVAGTKPTETIRSEHWYSLLAIGETDTGFRRSQRRRCPAPRPARFSDGRPGFYAGTVACSVGDVGIVITGRTTHGAATYEGVDPINVGCPFALTSPIPVPRRG